MLKNEKGKDMNETFTENLQSGGKLKIMENSWSIEYYFPGPDMRYRGEFVSIDGNKIDEYIWAWKTNFAKYMELSQQIPDGGEFTMAGEKGMRIHVGGFRSGVCLISYNLCIDTKYKLDVIIRDYEYAKVKATEIQKFLKTIIGITPESLRK